MGHENRAQRPGRAEVPSAAEPQESDNFSAKVNESVARLVGQFKQLDKDLYGSAFPLGRWDIAVADMVGSRLFVEFKTNGTFEMVQQVGIYQVPVTGNWAYNSSNFLLSLQGVVNTFQPFVLTLSLSGANWRLSSLLAVGSDGIKYTMTREEPK